MTSSRIGCLALALATAPLTSAVGKTSTAPVATAPDGGTSGAAAGPLRSVDAILADAIAATGGEGPWKAHHSMQTKTEVVYGKMGMSASRTQLLTSKNKSLAITTIPSVGTVNEGTNGKVAWSQDPVNGLRILSGAEAEQSHLESTWDVEHHLRELFRKIEVKNETADGRPLECLELTSKAGLLVSTCYDAATHLQVLQKGIAATPQGNIPFTSKTKEWKDFGGLKVPSLVEMTTGPIEFTARVTEVLFDQPVDDKAFELPAAGAKAKHKGAAATK